MAFRSPSTLIGNDVVLRKNETLKISKSRAKIGHSLPKQLLPPPSPFGPEESLSNIDIPGSSAGGSTHLITDDYDADNSQETRLVYPIDDQDGMKKNDELTNQVFSSIVWFSENIVVAALHCLIEELRDTLGYPSVLEGEDDYYDGEEEEYYDDNSFISEISDIFQTYDESNRHRIAARTITRSLVSGAFQMSPGLKVREEAVSRVRSLGSGAFPVVRSLGCGGFPLRSSACVIDLSTHGTRGATKRDGRLFGESCESRFSHEHEAECHFALKALGTGPSKQFDDPFPSETEDESGVGDTGRCTRAIEIYEQSRRVEEKRKVSKDPIIGMTIQYTLEHDVINHFH